MGCFSCSPHAELLFLHPLSQQASVPFLADPWTGPNSTHRLPHIMVCAASQQFTGLMKLPPALRPWQPACYATPNSPIQPTRTQLSIFQITPTAPTGCPTSCCAPPLTWISHIAYLCCFRSSPHAALLLVRPLGRRNQSQNRFCDMSLGHSQAALHHVARHLSTDTHIS